MSQDFEKQVYGFITESTADRAVMHEKLDRIEKHTKETNGAIAKAQKEILNLEKTIYAEDKKLFKKIVKLLVITLVIGTLFWVQESREVMLRLLGIVI